MEDGHLAMMWKWKPKSIRWVEPAILLLLCGLVFVRAPKFPSRPASPTVQPIEAPQRSPASAPSLSHAVLALGCVPGGKHIPPALRTNAGYARFSGQLCGRNSIVASDGINATTEATITGLVDRQAKRFATNYVPLKPGKNVVRLRYRLTGGRTAEDNFEVERIP